jgi:peptidoglycan/LPS O-acetylase OafA/YrhL
MKKQDRNPGIQALRALAAVLVLVYHAKWIPGGYIGVDIFYVISGYLITGLLIREISETGTLKFLRFYARRTKRLLPSSLTVIVVTGLSAWIIFPQSLRESLGRDLIAASTYISNFLFALWENDYQNLDTTPSPFIHFWSLAVEEQFYLVWPIIIVLLYKCGRRVLVSGVLAIFLSSFIFSLYLTATSPIWAFYILPTRAWELALGALLLFIPKKVVITSKFLTVSLVLIACLMIAYSIFIFDDATAFPGMAATLPVFATALLLFTKNDWPGSAMVIVRSRIVQWLGAISYPLYLWHWPVLVIPAVYLGRNVSTLETISLLLATVGLAGLTHRYIENPLRERRISDVKSLAYAGVATIICVLIGALIFTSQNNSVALASGKTFSLSEIRQKPASDGDGCHIKIRQTISPACEYGDTTAQESIFLYGDSHAAQWLPALDLIGKKRGIKVISLTKSSCAAAEVIKELSSQYVVEECQKFRDLTVARIKSESPLAVIMTGLQPPTAPYSNIPSRDWWLAGESKALDRIRDFTQYPIYLTDTPNPIVDIPDCLASGKLSRCDTSVRIDSEVAPGLFAINPTSWLCEEKCVAVIDGVVVYRDASHLSVAMSRYLAPRLEKRLEEIGVLSKT